MKKIIVIWPQRLKIITLIAAFLLLFSLSESEAQIVTIPDPNFVTYLQTNFPTAMSGNQMNTQDPAILNTITINVMSLGISDLTGIEHFINLQFLDCDNNNISFINSLPPVLQHFACELNPLTALPTLPPTLTNLDAAFCQIGFISSFPASLLHIFVRNNLLTSLPSLPPGLQVLHCENNFLSCLPVLPDTLNFLLATGNSITCLPNIPAAPAGGNFSSDIGTSICNNLNLTSVTNTLCFGDCNGAATATTIAGTSYDYTWSNGFTDLNNSTGSSTASGLCAGTYILFVQEAGGGGCPSQISFTVNQPAQLNINISTTTNVSCFGGNDGLLCVNATGGTTPYIYLWNNGATSQCVTNLNAGTYSITVMDANSCSATISATVTEPPPLIITTPSNVTICQGTDLCVAVARGTPPYNYLWSTGSFTNCITSPSAGIYTITVTDINSCTASTTFNLTISSPPVIDSTTSTPMTCGINNATVCIYASGGTPPYMYPWGPSQCGSGLGPVGTYFMTVTDVNGCTASTQVIITSISPPILIIDSIQNVSCFGGNDGAIFTTISAGTSPYSYLWSNNATTQDLINLFAGTYTITVTDANNCNVQSSITLGCDSVWPGDANYDGIANNLDLLPIGIAYGSTGIVRSGATNNWVGQAANDWGVSLASGTDYKHVDCNGDGIINDADTIAISLNYGMTHPLRLMPNPPGLLDPYLYFNITVDTAGTGQEVDVQLMFGTSAVPADSIYGLAFTVNYDTALVKADSVNISFSPSWIGTVGTDMLTVQHNDPLNGQLHVGMTRTDHNNVSGFGEIAKVTVVTVDNVSGRMLSTPIIDTLTFSLSGVLVIDKDETPRTINIGNDSLIVQDSTTSIHEILFSEKIKVYPNPVKDKLFIEFPYKLFVNEISISNIIGDTLGNDFAIKNNIVEIKNLKNFSNGIYLLKIKTDRGTIVKKFSVIH